MKKRQLMVFSLIVVFIIVVIQPIFALDGQSILKDIYDRQNLRNGSYVLDLKITSIKDTDSSIAEVNVYMKKNDRQIVTFISPEKLSDDLYLVVGYNTWMYKNNLRRPIRISAQQKLFGDAGIAEAAGIDYLHDYQISKINETGNQYILELKALDQRASYQSAIMSISKEGLQIQKITLMAISGKPLKDLLYSNHHVLSGHEIATIEVRNLLQVKNQYTIMEFEKITERPLSNELFDPLMMSKFKILINQ